MIDLWEAMKARHSVRRYLDRPIEAEKAEALQSAMRKINEEQGLHFQLMLDEPTAFTGPLAHYGSFRDCKNYFILAGPAGRDEDVGYYGEELVLLAQQLGLNTCWAALTFRKGKVKPRLNAGEKPYLVIALGYGATQGVAHKNRPLAEVCRMEADEPDWFRRGMEAVLTAPTAVNQQKFFFSHQGDAVSARALRAPLSALDLGIAKYHFAVGAGDHPFTWAKE